MTTFPIGQVKRGTVVVTFKPCVRRARWQYGLSDMRIAVLENLVRSPNAWSEVSYLRSNAHGVYSKYQPHQGKREKARRLRVG